MHNLSDPVRREELPHDITRDGARTGAYGGRG